MKYRPVREIAKDKKRLAPAPRRKGASPRTVATPRARSAKAAPVEAAAATEASQEDIAPAGLLCRHAPLGYRASAAGLSRAGGNGRHSRLGPGRGLRDRREIGRAHV